MQDETMMDPMYQGAADMRGMIATHGIEVADRLVAEAWAPPFDLNAQSRLRGIIRAAYEAGQLDGITTKKERVF